MSSFLCHFSFSRGRKSFVEIDAGDKGTVPNGWIHKMVRFSGGTARFGGSHLIHWDTTLRHSNFIRGLRLIAGQHPTWKIWKGVASAHADKEWVRVRRDGRICSRQRDETTFGRDLFT